MDKEKIISLENLNQYSEETSGKIKEKIAEHTDNTNVHVTTADKSNWNGKFDSNQGTSNAGKLLGTNSNGDVIAIQGYGFEYDEATKMLKYGTDPTTNLNQGIGLDDTLSKKGYAAEASAVGELKSDIENIYNINHIREKDVEPGIYSLTTGEKCPFPECNRTINLISVKKQTITFFTNQEFTVAGFNENDEFLRATSPLIQGKNKVVYLGDDVKKIGITMVGNPNISYREDDYYFPFEYELIDGLYVSTQLVTIIPGIKSKKYTFEYNIYNLPIVGGHDLIIGSQDVHYDLGSNGKVYYGNVNEPYTKVISVPFYSDINIYFAKLGYSTPNNLSICCYGTSITNTLKEGKYPKYLQAYTKTNNFEIKGISGGMYSSNIKNMILEDTNNYDIILLEGCTNDFYNSIPFETMRTSIKQICENISTRCKRAFFVIDHSARDYESMKFEPFYKNNLDITDREYELEVSKIFGTFGIPSIDAGVIAQINCFKSEYYADQIHHSELGGKVYAKAIYDELIKNNVINDF